MKQKFKREKIAGYESFLDETNNHSYGKDILTRSKKRKLTQKQRRKYLDDLGTGSETEFESARQLYNYQDDSSEFLEYLLKCCNKRNSCLHPELSYALLIFKENKRVYPALLKSAKNIPDEHFSNYAGLLGIFGGEKSYKLLHKRFNKIKDNPKTFKKKGDWNDLALTLIFICEEILKREPENTQVAEILVRLSKHRCHFTRDTAMWAITRFYNARDAFMWREGFNILIERLNSLKRTKDARLFLIGLRYLLHSCPEKTYNKLKKYYLNGDLQFKNEIAFQINYFENSAYWLSRLIRDLPKKETLPLREVLDCYLVTPIKSRELEESINDRFQSESPSTRVMALNHLRNISKSGAIKLVKKALKDEPDDFIRKEFEKYINNKVKINC